jgi:hypothetical protein
VKNKVVTPKEIKKNKSKEIKSEIPDFVFQIFNELISMKYKGDKEIIILQDEVIDLILQHDTSIERQDIFENKWLDVEASYRNVGWKVEYEKPIAWGGEDFEAHFVFSFK